MTILDVHAHAVSDEYVRAAGGDDRRELDGLTVAEWSPESHLDAMASHGIDIAILSCPELSDALSGPAGRDTARRLNEHLAGFVADHPGQFGGLAVVPIDDMDATATEMAYALDELQLDGVSTSPHRQGVYLGDAFYDPWFEEMNRRGVSLFVHPSKPPYFDVATNQMNVSVLEFMFETTRMVTSLVLSGAKRRFPEINVIAPHAGGTIPYLAHRISIISQMPWAFRDGAQLSVQDVAEDLGTFYYDLTASTSAAQLDAVRTIVAPGKLLLGFDYPLMPPETIDPALADLTAYGGFEGDDWRAISAENAKRLFPRLSAPSLTAE